VTDTGNVLAGFTAKSSSDTYLEVLVGDGKNDSLLGSTKSIKDSHNVKKGTLNPLYF
jgi:hypothetical protein